MNNYRTLLAMAFIFLLSFGITYALTVSSTTSNTLVDSGQLQNITATISGGTSPYTVNFFNITASTTQYLIGYNTWLAATAMPESSGGFPNWQNCVSYGLAITCLNAGSTLGSANGANFININTANGLSLGTWGSTNTFSLAAAGTISSEGCTTNYANIICAGGQVTTGSARIKGVYYAPLFSNGAIGTWQAGNGLPFNQSGVGCVTYNWMIYCIGASTGSSKTFNQVNNAIIYPSGNIAAWAIQANHYPINTVTTCIVGDTNNIYCVGGQTPASSSTGLTNVYYAPILAQGTVGTWVSETNSYPTNILDQPCVYNQYGATGNYIYCVGGKTSSSTFSNVIYYAPIFSSGEVGAWIASTANYLTNVEQVPCVTSTNMIYCIGGTIGSGSTGTANTFYAPLNNWGVANQLSDIFITNTLPSASGNSNTFNFNISVTDATPTTVNTIPLPFTVNTYPSTPTMTVSNTPQVAAGTTEVFTANWLAGSEGTSPFTYNFIVVNTYSPSTIYANLLIANSFVGNTFVLTIPSTANAGDGNTLEANIVITDSATTNVIFKSAYSSAILVTNTVSSSYLPPSNPTLTLSNTFIDQGQSILFTAGVTNGNDLFTYNFIVQAYNSLNSQNVIIGNFLSGAVAARADTWFWTPNPNLYIGNSIFQDNVIITEAGAYSNTVNTVYQSFGYNSVAKITITQVSNTLLDSGQTVTFTLTDTGGTDTGTYGFNAELYNVTGLAQRGTNAPILSVGGSNTIHFVVHSPTSPSGGNVFKYNSIETDTGTTYPFITNSVATSISVNQPLAVSISPTTPTITQGSSETFTATVTPGQPTYTYNWIASNSAGFSANLLIVGNSFTQNQFIVTPVAVGTYNVNVVVTDSATTPENAYTANAVLTVSASYIPPTTPSLTLSNTRIDQGQSILFKASFSNGAEPYTYNYLVYSYNTLNAVNSIIANQLYTSCSITTNSWFWTPNPNLYIGNSIFEANVAVTDVDTATVNSPFNSFGYNAVFSPVSIVSTNTLLANSYVEEGAPTNITAVISGGTAPYTFNYVVSNTATGNILSSQIYTSLSPTNSYTFTYPSTGGYINNALGTYTITVNVIDSATINTNALMVNSSNAGEPQTPYEASIRTLVYCNATTSQPTNYSNVSAHYMAIIYPTNVPAGAMLPVAFYIHGGGLATSNTRNTTTLTYTRLAIGPTSPICLPTDWTGNCAIALLLEKGYAVAFPMYRVNAQTAMGYDPAVMPSMIIDTACAIRTVRANANKWGLQQYHYVAFGDSAGAYLIPYEITGEMAYNAPAWARQGAYNTISPNLTSSADMFGYYNITATGSVNFAQENTIFGAPTSTSPILQYYSSSNYLRNDLPPFLLQAGYNDTQVQHNQSVFIYNGVFNGMLQSPQSLLAYNDFVNLTLVINADHEWLPSNSMRPIVPSLAVLANSVANWLTTTNIGFDQIIWTGSKPNYPTLGNVGNSNGLVGNTMKLDSGQVETFTPAFTGGEGPYTFNFYNVTGTKIAQIQQNANTNNAMPFVFTAFSPTVGNSFKYNLTVTDGSLNVTNSITYNLVVDPALTVSISPTTNTFITGNSQTFIATVTPGTGPYTYNWQASNTAGFSANLLAANNAITQNQFIIGPLYTGTYNVNVVVTDSATTPNVANSVNAILAVGTGHTCSFSTNVSTINFGTLHVGTNTGGTINTIAVTDVGTAGSNILIYGTNWIGNLGDQYLPENTIYNSLLESYFVPPLLTTITTDTYIPVNILSPNSISFGTAIPLSVQGGETFSQTISLLSSC